MMEKVKITKVDVKESGMFVVGFTSGFGDEGEATGNIKWQDKECAYLKNSINQIVSLETKQNGKYCNIVKVDITQPISAEGKDAYDKYAMIENHHGEMIKIPITDSEKVGNVPKANLMSQKDISIVSQVLLKAAFYAKGGTPQEVLDAYRFFVLELEQNG